MPPFAGRSARKEYAVFTVANFVLSAVLGLIPVIGGLFSLIIIIPGIAVAVRRLHDLNKSGWWLLAPFLILIIGLIGVAGTVEEGGAAAMVWLMVAGGIMSLGDVHLAAVWPGAPMGANRFGDVQQDNGDSAPPGAQSAPVSSAEDVRERLAQATKMRDDGTISESEYETIALEHY
ncbi:Inner membrane protein yhaI [Raoultella terrigena]|uniref:Inner membrane protein yhaI n=1 Tax=Raoultella terrigena TaxID=577 RepID=A0A3P8IW04_RAOTE|nr:Inner membrane protein yhaI [Raoultella terrigena]